VTGLTIMRTCACGCKEIFQVPGSRPGQLYKNCHRPKTVKSHSTEARKSEEPQKLLDYRCALQRARTELSDTTAQIDAAEQRLGELKDQSYSMRKIADELAARHLLLRGVIECLEALIDGKATAIVQSLA
jgi:chromosome segregation ATPase